LGINLEGHSNMASLSQITSINWVAHQNFRSILFVIMHQHNQSECLFPNIFLGAQTRFVISFFMVLEEVLSSW
jgi:hypothetical protein